MTRPLRFDPPARRELNEAADFHDAEDPGLGAAFLGAAERAFEQIQAFGELSTKVHHIAEHGDFYSERLPACRPSWPNCRHCAAETRQSPASRGGLYAADRVALLSPGQPPKRVLRGDEAFARLVLVFIVGMIS